MKKTILKHYKENRKKDIKTALQKYNMISEELFNNIYDAGYTRAMNSIQKKLL